jgi:glucosamine-6-phosphate deaminase
MIEIEKDGLKILQFEKESKAVDYVSNLIVNQIKKKPNSTLGLASGETMIPLYKKLVSLYNNKKINFSKVKTFCLDEYIGAKERDTFKFFLEKHFLSKVNVMKVNQNFLSAERYCKDYEKKIEKSHGIDLLILGIGRNGHIAFNEPGSRFNSRTRKVRLMEQTRKVNKKFFRNLKEVPKEALTIGIGTILDAREIILLAFGRSKARAIEASLSGRPRAQWPASALRNHKKVEFVVDKFSAYR